jgi:hypothetical protein
MSRILRRSTQLASAILIGLLSSSGFARTADAGICRSAQGWSFVYPTLPLDMGSGYAVASSANVERLIARLAKIPMREFNPRLALSSANRLSLSEFEELVAYLERHFDIALDGNEENLANELFRSPISSLVARVCIALVERANEHEAWLQERQRLWLKGKVVEYLKGL